MYLKTDSWERAHRDDSIDLIWNVRKSSRESGRLPVTLSDRVQTVLVEAGISAHKRKCRAKKTSRLQGMYRYERRRTGKRTGREKRCGSHYYLEVHHRDCNEQRIELLAKGEHRVGLRRNKWPLPSRWSEERGDKVSATKEQPPAAKSPLILPSPLIW